VVVSQIGLRPIYSSDVSAHITPSDYAYSGKFDAELKLEWEGARVRIGFFSISAYSDFGLEKC
jgi:hypothetical protein